MSDADEDGPLPSAAPEEAKAPALPSAEADDDEEEDETEAPEADGKTAKAAAPAAPDVSGWKFLSRFILFFLFFLGLWMILPIPGDDARTQVAGAFGDLLAPVFGFGGDYILLTMFLAAALEMGISAVAYQITTDWIHAAHVAKDQAALRPHQMKAIRSGKKDRMDALKPHIESLQERQMKVTFSQLKGMAVTWVMLIAIYTWVGLYVDAHPLHAQVDLFGASVNLATTTVAIFPIWFLVFSLYTVPLNLIFRRYLKHAAFSNRLKEIRANPPPATGAPA